VKASTAQTHRPAARVRYLAEIAERPRLPQWAEGRATVARERQQLSVTSDAAT
jgi:hypothetical protein